MSILGVLLTGALNLWLLTAFNWTFIQLSTPACKIFPFLIYTMLDFSVIIIVIMTSERFFAVSRPLKVTQRFNKKKSSIFVLLGFIICATINSHFLFTHSIIGDDYLNYSFQNVSNETLVLLSSNNTFFENLKETNNLVTTMCSYVKWNTFYESYWPFIDAVIYSFLPFILLSFFNVSIIGFLKKAENDSSMLRKHKAPLFDNITSDDSPIKNSFRKSSEIGLFSNNRQMSRNSSISSRKISTIVKYDKINQTCIFTTTTPNKSSFLKKTLRFSEKKRNYKGINKRLTLMLFLINISFCVLSMPMAVLQIIHYYKSNLYYNNINEYQTLSFGFTNKTANSSDFFDYYTNNDYNNDQYNNNGNYTTYFNLLLAIAELLQYLNHSSNFFFYCLSGKTFRKETILFLSSRFYYLIELKNSIYKKLRLRT